MTLWTQIAALTGGTLLLATQGMAQTTPPRDLFADTWAATDALNRKLPVAPDVRERRSDRFVGIFYFLWQGGHGTPGPYDISKALAANPANPTLGPESAFHWWGEPAAGYFLASDPWVIRRNLAMLQYAGVDVLLLDVTNAVTYPETVVALGKVAMQMRSEGNQTPQIAFVTHAHSAATVKKLYDEFYAKNLFPELWFRWQGKPLILGIETDRLPGGQPLDKALRDFFTWRDSWAWDPGKHKWPWIDRYPQRYGYDKDPNVPEEAPVAVASHPTLNIGRSFHEGAEPPVDKLKLSADVERGLYFAEQWKRLLEIDPQFCFIDGWNEWVAQRFTIHTTEAVDMLGRRLKRGETYFVDAYNEEFSRDIEPMKGGYGDNYYYQMVEGIRRFKGARPAQKNIGYKTFAAKGDLAAWKTVTPEYCDTIGDTAHRDFDGWGGLHYKNETGRNDIVLCKAACDAKNIYFYVQTREPLTRYTDKDWMRLLINTDRIVAGGWEGYNYIINNPVVDAATTTLTRLSDGRVSKIPYRVVGNAMQITVPRALLSLNNLTHTVFQFHWLDNLPYGGDIADWWLNGDSAPDGRFNYRFENVR